MKIILTLLLIIVFWFWLSNARTMRKFNKDKKRTFDAHKKIGFPSLSKTTQCQIMATGDYAPIINLTPVVDGIYNGLLKYYITITKEEFRDYLVTTNSIQKYRIIEDPDTWLRDGLWLKEYSDRKILVDQERGNSVHSWIIQNDLEAIVIISDILWRKLDFE